MTETANLIAQLERQRSALDNAIEALRDITGETTTQKQTPKRAAKKGGRSTEGRERQIEAMRKYWAAKKAGKGAARKATKKNKRSSMSAASRKRMAAGQRKRWAAVRAQQG